MARFLFVAPPLTGHVNPAVSLAERLQAAGQEVAWVGFAGRIRPLLPDGSELFALDDDAYDALEAGFQEESQRVRLLESLIFLWERVLVPLARLMAPGVEAAIDAYQPDLLVVDQQALAGALVARRRDLPWATLAPSAVEAVPPSDPGAKMIWDFIDGQLTGLQREFGLAPVPRPDNSPQAVLICSTPALFGERDYPAHYHFVGPLIAQRPERSPFPWDRLQPGRRVLVSLGTVSPARGARFYRTVAEALADQPCQVVLVAPADALETIPANFIVHDYVPQLRLLPEVDAVICHAGHNTVSEALFHGIPLVVLPIRDDQPIVASLVTRAGAGLRLKFGRLRAADLREATCRILEEPAFRQAAARIQSSFAAAGGADRAAEILIRLARPGLG